VEGVLIKMATLYTDFSGRDYTANFERLLTILGQEVPELTDFNHSDAGISIIRLLCRETDMLSFYIDEVFAESFLYTARYKQSIIDIIKALDLYPKMANAASAVVTLELTPYGITLGNPVTIPKYTPVSRLDGVSYLTLAPVVLNPTHTSEEVPVIQGALQTQTLQANAFTTSFDVSGKPKYNLGANVAAYTVEVSENIDTPWTLTSSFYRSMPTDRHFMLEVLGDAYNGVVDTVFLTIGDGVYGQGVPSGGLTVSYIITGGPAGNCGANVINRLDQTSAFFSLVRVASSTMASGGSFVESIEPLRKRVPAVVHTQRRAVTLDDYTALIQSIPGVCHCQGADRNYGDEWPHFYVVLFVVPEGGGEMSQILLDRIYTQLFEWGHLGDWKERYLLYNATPVPLDVTCSIGITIGYIVENVRSQVIDSITNLISVDNMEIGGILSFSDVHQAVSRVPGVAWVEFSSPTHDIRSDIGFVTTLGTVTVTIA
jgi:hypothetical protein